jgi:fluoroquinolone resistance protein
MMGETYQSEKIFDKLDLKVKPLAKGTYEDCTFKSCNLEQADLAHINFTDCEFIECNLSMANISDTKFQNIKFKGCKMLGLRFDHCNKFGFEVNFETCILDHASFFNTRVTNSVFKESSLVEVDFTDCDLTNSAFINSNLLNAVFERTNLSKADLRDAGNFSIDPELNTIKKAKFSIHGVAGLLHKYDIQISLES